MRVLVVGAGVSGKAARRLLASEGHHVVVYDRDPEATAGLEHAAVGPWHAGLLAGVDLVVASPGVPEHAPPLRDALAVGATVWSEVELAARRLSAPYAAVTATNGKTTVTAAAAAMLEASGVRAAAVGNIGDPLSGAVGTDLDALVIEVSSFQLRFIDEFHPAAAVLLNVAPDHLDWHGTFEAYLAAKARIYERMGPDDVLVHDGDDPGAVRAVAAAGCRVVPVSGTRRLEGGGPDGDLLWIGDVPVARAAMERTDPAFSVDLVAAGIVALHLGASPDGVAAAATGFRSEHHRRELIGTRDGIAWVNDSKATNPHAALSAIRAYPSVILLAGGRNKGLDVAALAAEPSVRVVVGLGEAGPEIVAAARHGEMAPDMEHAVAVASREARPGDTVLLAPGCASFDQFESYADRGEAFAAAVRAELEASWPVG